MPAKGENTAPPNPFREEEYKADFTSPGFSAQIYSDEEVIIKRPFVRRCFCFICTKGKEIQ